jgi:hypothetical protein
MKGGGKKKIKRRHPLSPTGHFPSVSRPLVAAAASVQGPDRNVAPAWARRTAGTVAVALCHPRCPIPWPDTCFPSRPTNNGASGTVSTEPFHWRRPKPLSGVHCPAAPMLISPASTDRGRLYDCRPRPRSGLAWLSPVAVACGKPTRDAASVPGGRP